MSLEKWIIEYYHSQEYQNLIARFQDIPDAITMSHETAMLYALIKHIKPKLCLEIGSFFCHTTRIMAEALLDHFPTGKILTIDPYRMIKGLI
jgi:predicted O-methyltransferase YrrM